MSTPQLSLADYAVIGDCRTAALVSKWGSIDWLCLPDFDSPSLFAAVLDSDKGGRFQITVKDATATSRHYVKDTAVLETTISSSEGAIKITDCMPIIGNARQSKELQPLREIIRRVEVIKGSPSIQVNMDVKPDYARHKGRFRFRGGLGWCFQHGRYLLNLLSNFPLQSHDGELGGIHPGKAGEVYWFSFTFDAGNPAVLIPIGQKSDTRIQATITWWHGWCQQCRYEGKYRDQIIRSAITLRMLTFTLSGALLAAATTSLPEKLGGWMNWDYRYCWPRDSALALSAFMSLGLRNEADAFFDWLMLAASVGAPKLHVMYNVYGEYRIRERFLSHLAGYKASRPVRIGNQLSHQVQNDVTGEVMGAVEDWIQHFGKPETFQCTLIQGFGKRAAKTWREPDNGIWEIRDTRRHYTYSKAMAWHVFDSSLRLSDSQHLKIPVEHYRKEMEELRQDIETRGFNEKRNCYTGVFDSDTLDASLLLLPRYGYVDYHHPRMTGTWQAIQNDLEHKGLILRYPPGFANSQNGEGAFIICNFWAVDYLSGSGECEEAEERLNRLIGLANDVGLYSECIDTETHEPLGNLPQTFSHAGLINSVTMLEKCQRKTRENVA